MGAVTALYGIRGCMSILHGSQGCATYIRRHMATHYNEPVDVASSSLTEQGTVFGGEENLLRGIDNLIAQYHPEVVGVATTCLAETIGEDVGAILHKYRSSHPNSKVKLLSVASPGYGGTQNEGYFRALRSVLEQVEMERSSHSGINIITPHISPADTRWLKDLLNFSGLSYVLLPDLSENLDGVHAPVYDRLPNQGTSLEQISAMAGAQMTIELSQFVEPELSPAQYLYDIHQVPFVRLGLPVGIEATDTFINVLEDLGATFPPALEQERGRLADTMIDAHKYCADARTAVFGEPDLVAACVGLCLENGTIPLVAAAGSVCPSLSQALLEPMSRGAALWFEQDPIVCSDCDFEQIEALCLSQKVNLMIGNSDGRRISHRQHIPLIRLGFPIHDRVGGQHVRMLGYTASQQLVEQIANTMLARKEEGFRQELYQRYYQQKLHRAAESPITLEAIAMPKTIEERTLTHPCYTCSGTKNARIHLPVAPKCNIQCNYCVRKFDCPNESRPGVTTEILSPQQAADKYFAVREKVPNLTVVGIAGPGDALANFEETRETLRLIREQDQEVTFCLSTNGLLLPLYAQELIDLGVSHVTITINAVNPQIGADIYHHVNYLGTRYTGVEAASILMANQLAGLQYLSRRGVQCKVNIVVLKGCNHEHVPQIVQTVKELGACITNIMQLIPVEGSAFADMPQVSMAEIHTLRKNCGKYLPQMLHCRQCRADAIGTLDNDLSIAFRGKKEENISLYQPDEPELPVWRVAVASKSGMLVDVHFGHANTFYIYESDGKTVCFIERRDVNRYCGGKADCDQTQEQKESVLDVVADCQAVTALRIGEAPSRRLEAAGIIFFPMYERIEEAVGACAKKLSQTSCAVRKG